MNDIQMVHVIQGRFAEGTFTRFIQNWPMESFAKLGCIQAIEYKMQHQKKCFRIRFDEHMLRGMDDFLFSFCIIMMKQHKKRLSVKFTGSKTNKSSAVGSWKRCKTCKLRCRDSLNCFSSSLNINNDEVVQSNFLLSIFCNC